MSRNATNTRPPAQVQGTDQGAGTYYAQHDFDGPAKLSTTVVHALSEVANIDATNTESTLFQHVDPDALDHLFKPVNTKTARTTGHVSFAMWGYDITVYSNGQIVISTPQQPVQ